MFQSKEIRWFSEEKNKFIIDWFGNQGLSISNSTCRTDYYLPLAKDDISIKLREGNIEIKNRIGAIGYGHLTARAEGAFENWVKWSFNVAEKDRLSNEIEIEQKYNWIKTIKNRIGVKIVPQKNCVPQIISIKKKVPYGCQIEYTQVVIQEKAYYTFALEWFGNEILHLDEDFLMKVTGESAFAKETSMGYAAFLKKINHEQNK